MKHLKPFEAKLNDLYNVQMKFEAHVHRDHVKYALNVVNIFRDKAYALENEMIDYIQTLRNKQEILNARSLFIQKLRDAYSDFSGKFYWYRHIYWNMFAESPRYIEQELKKLGEHSNNFTDIFPKCKEEFKPRHQEQKNPNIKPIDVDKFAPYIPDTAALQKKTISDLQSEISKLTQQKNNLQQTNQSLIQKNNELQKTQQTLSNQNSELQKLQQTLNKQNNELQRSYQTVSNRKEKLKQKNKILSQENKNLRQSNTDFSRKNYDLQQTNNSLTEQNRNLQDSINSYIQKNKNLQSTHQSLSQQIYILNQQYTNTQTMLNSLSMNINNLKQVQDKLNQENTKLKEQNQELTSKNEQLQKLQENLSRQNTNLKEANHNIFQQNLNLHNENKKLEQQNEEMPKHIDETPKELKQQINNLKKKNQTLLDKNSSLASSVYKRNEDLASLEASIQNKEQIVESLEREIAPLRFQHKELTQSVNQLIEKTTKLTEEINNKMCLIHELNKRAYYAKGIIGPHNINMAFGERFYAIQPPEKPFDFAQSRDNLKNVLKEQIISELRRIKQGKKWFKKTEQKIHRLLQDEMDKIEYQYQYFELSYFQYEQQIQSIEQNIKIKMQYIQSLESKIQFTRDSLIQLQRIQEEANNKSITSFFGNVSKLFNKKLQLPKTIESFVISSFPSVSKKEQEITCKLIMTDDEINKIDVSTGNDESDEYNDGIDDDEEFLERYKFILSNSINLEGVH